MIKIYALIQAVEHPQILRMKNFKSVAMATVIARYAQNLVISGSSWGQTYHENLVKIYAWVQAVDLEQYKF